MNTLQTIYADHHHVKHLGRVLFQDSILWLALSGSGIAFTFYGRHLELCLQGDDNADSPTQDDKARFAIWIDDIRVMDTTLTEPEMHCTLIDNTFPAAYHVRVVKLSEAPMSIIGIRQLAADDEAVFTPAKESERKIEFIGDSITCGYGIDDDNLDHAFSTATEDVTKAYAYLTSQALHADYSMVSYSGHGIISGYTETDEKKEEELIPPFYPLVGFSHGTYKGCALTDTPWDFSAFIPDLIVINLGTNDDSYCQDIISRQEEFSSQYRAFLKEVRDKNPRAVILCSYGLMNERLYPHIEKAVLSYRKECGDENIHLLRFTMQTENDGYVINYHPSIKTHNAAAWVLTQKIKEIMKW